jgi:hypothetical protein
MSRLDRILVSDGWLAEWGSVTLWALKRDVSDHCPIILKYDGYDWGPKPFRFNNHWLLNKDLPNLVEAEWNSYQVCGWMGFVLKEKLKRLKGALRKWNKEVYGSVDSKIADLMEGIEVLDLKGESGGLSEVELLLRKAKFSQLWLLL